MRLAAVGVMLVLMVVGAGCIRVTDANGNKGYLREGGVEMLASSEVAEETVKALVKGSIYETGEQVSVFGTCLNSSDGGIIGSTATMSAWYPNGTLFFDNVSMAEMQPGYFLYSGSMSAVPGTYLTEFTCRVPNSDVVAKAFGEWQNPQWVRKIGDTNDTVHNIYNQTQYFQNLTQQWFELMMGQLANVSVQVNYTYVNLSTQIQYVGQVANASVDRNDSYLAGLLQGIAGTTGTPQSGNLRVEMDADRVKYLKDWRLEVIVYNEYNQTVGYPPVECLVTTNNLPATVGVPMTFEGNGKTLLFEQENKNYFYHVEKIKVTYDFNWTVDCHYVP